MGEVVDDAHQRYEPAVEPPAGLLFVEAVKLAQDRAAPVAQPIEQQLTLVGVALGDVDDARAGRTCRLAGDGWVSSLWPCHAVAGYQGR